MCHRYHPSRAEELAHYRDTLGISEPPRGQVGDPLCPRDIGPSGKGVFIRPRRELFVRAAAPRGGGAG